MPSTELELVIAASIDATRIESDLGDLVRAPSVTGREEGIQLEIVARLEEADIPVERITPTPEEAAADPDWPGAEMPRASLPIVVARVGRPGGRKILLVGHVDVVPPGDPALWCRPATRRCGRPIRGAARSATAGCTGAARAT